MNKDMTRKTQNDKLIIKRCHCCGAIIENYNEPQKCTKCNKSFLPTNYFSKIEIQKPNKFNELFLESSELHEEDFIKGLSVLW